MAKALTPGRCVRAFAVRRRPQHLSGPWGRCWGIRLHRCRDRAGSGYHAPVTGVRICICKSSSQPSPTAKLNFAAALRCARLSLLQLDCAPRSSASAGAPIVCCHAPLFGFCEIPARLDLSYVNAGTRRRDEKRGRLMSRPRFDICLSQPKGAVDESHRPLLFRRNDHCDNCPLAVPRVAGGR